VLVQIDRACASAGIRHARNDQINSLRRSFDRNRRKTRSFAPKMVGRYKSRPSGALKWKCRLISVNGVSNLINMARPILFVSKYLERTAGHATNIAEMVVFW
jgi:hypothetical protein